MRPKQCVCVQHGASNWWCSAGSDAHLLPGVTHVCLLQYQLALVQVVSFPGRRLLPTRRHCRLHSTSVRMSSCYRRINQTIYFCCPTSVFLQQNMFHNALNWSSWYSCFTWNFLWRLTWAWLTFLSANEFINDGSVVWRTNRPRSTVTPVSVSTASFVNLLIKSFRVMCFHCLEGNTFIILSVPPSFSTHNAGINTLLSLVNGRLHLLRWWWRHIEY